MEEQIQFNDESLKRAIVVFWSKQGIVVDDTTAQKFVKDIRDKMKSSTTSELQLALSELKMELTPEAEASLEYGKVIKASMTSFSKLFSDVENILLKVEAGKLSRDDLRIISDELKQITGTVGKKNRKWQLEVLKTRIEQKNQEYKQILAMLDAVDNYDKASDVDGEIEKLASNKKLKQIALSQEDLFNASLQKNPRITGSQFESSMGESLNKLDDLTGSFEWTNPETKKKVKIWTRKRLNFELQLGITDPAKLKYWEYKKDLYKDFVSYYKQLETLVGEQLSSMMRISEIMNTPIQKMDQLATFIPSMYYHSKPEKGEKGLGQATEQLTEKRMQERTDLERASETIAKMREMRKLLEEAKELFGEYTDEIALAETLDKKQEEVAKFRASKFVSEIEYSSIPRSNMTPEELKSLTSLHPVLERKLFDQSFIGGALNLLDPRGPGAANLTEEERLYRQRVKSDAPANAWTLGNIRKTDEGTIRKINSSPVTWKKGFDIYYHSFWPENEVDKKRLAETNNNCIRGIRKAIFPLIKAISTDPSMNPEERKNALRDVEKYKSGITEDRKKAFALDRKIHWSTLFNLAKGDIERSDPETYIKNSQEAEQFTEQIMRKYPSLRSKKEYLENQIHRQIKDANPINIRSMVAINPHTPDWVLMYMAQTDEHLQAIALSELNKRGWIPKLDENGVPVTSETNWVFEKNNSQSEATVAKISSRDIVVAAVDPQIESLRQQMAQLEIQNKQLTDRRKALQVQIDQRQNVIDQQKQQTTAPAQAQDNTNSAQPSIYQPAPAIK